MLICGTRPAITSSMADPDRFLADIEQFCLEHDLTSAKFGVLSVNDWRFVNDLRGVNRARPRRVWPETEHVVRAFMKAYAGLEQHKPGSASKGAQTAITGRQAA
jgi:hypothetical protein